MITHLKQKLSAMTRSREEGSIAVLIALAIFMLVLATGVAVDMARAQILQAKIQSSLDAAGLASVASLSSKPAGTDVTDLAWVTTQAKRYFDINFRPGYQDTSTPIVPSVTLDADEQTYTFTVLSSQSTTFMNVAGVSNVRVGALSKVTRAMGGIGMELVIVMDNTGSMNYDLDSGSDCGGCATSKIVAVKNAANNLLDILYGKNNDTAPNLFVGLVPFSSTVNIGPSNTNFLNKGAKGADAVINNDWSPGGSWAGCVMARPEPDDLTDLNPGQTNGGFDVFWYPPNPAETKAEADALIGMFDYYTNHNPQRDDYTKEVVYPAYGWRKTNGDGSFTYAPYKPGLPISSITQGPNAQCPPPITVMTKSKASVKASIEALSPIGWTLANEGLVWGWHLISPNWRGWWGGDMEANKLPLDYSDVKSKKVIILMSDGANSLNQYGYTSYGWMKDYIAKYTAYTITKANNDMIRVALEDIMDQKTLAVCKSLKDNGVIVYTIGFGKKDVDSDDFAYIDEATLKGCATDDDHYFYAPSNEKLAESFKQIANSLVNLRISQ